jgi:outer membrane protein OmpA-like peptidoglycan-associated protein
MTLLYASKNGRILSKPIDFHHLLITILLLLIQKQAVCQNLLANGGFEDENICTEYSKNCAPEAWIATSLRSNYYVDAPGYAHGGSHFTGLIVGNRSKPGVRSFIRAQLLCGLRKGHVYQLVFFIRSAHDVLDSISVYFSSNDFLFEKKYFKEIHPQLWAKDGLEATNKNPQGWHRVQFNYTANGEEEFITIGDFKHDDYYGIDRPDFENDYYFFLDDVTLIPMDIHEKLCSEADSVKKVLYNQNERHDLLEKKIYAYKKKPPPVLPLPQTINIRIDTLVIPDIFFATASFKIKEENYSVLNDFCGKMANRTIDSLVVEGHTDSIGRLDYNEKLSEYRARSVQQYVQQKTALSMSKIRIKYYASLKPAATNSTPEGRQKNRRVEIYLYTHE